MSLVHAMKSTTNRKFAMLESLDASVHAVVVYPIRKEA